MTIFAPENFVLVVMRFKQIVSFLLLVIYATFFASAHLCYHTHQLANGEIVHSHLYGDKIHNHNSAQLQFIDQLTTAPYQSADLVEVEPFVPEFSEFIIIAPEAGYQLLDNILSFSLRAPPVLF